MVYSFWACLKALGSAIGGFYRWRHRSRWLSDLCSPSLPPDRLSPQSVKGRHPCQYFECLPAQLHFTTRADQGDGCLSSIASARLAAVSYTPLPVKSPAGSNFAPWALRWRIHKPGSLGISSMIKRSDPKLGQLEPSAPTGIGFFDSSRKWAFSADGDPIAA